MPMDTDRFTGYKPTTLERTHKFEHWTEHDMGIAVDLVLPDAYAVAETEEFELDPKDEILLEEDFGSTKDRKRSQRHAKPISWMRKPDYISTEQTRYQPTTIDKVESKVGFSVFKNLSKTREITKFSMTKITIYFDKLVTFFCEISKIITNLAMTSSNFTRNF